MSIKKKILALVSAFALALPLVGCNEETKTMGKIKDTEINAGIYIFYTIEGYNDAFSKLSEDDATIDEENIWSKKIDKVSINDYINNYATDRCVTIVSVDDKFEELKLKLTADDEKALDRSLRNEWEEFGSNYTKNGISKKSIEQILLANYKQDLIFKHYYMEDGIKPVPEKEIIDEINDKYARVKILPLSLLDDKYEPLDALEKSKVLEQAEDYIERVKKGENFDDMIDAFYEEKYPSSSSTSSEDEEELGENRNEIIVYEGYEYIDEKSVEAMLKQSVSTTPEIIKGEKNYYVVEKLDIAEDEETIETLTEGIIYTLKKDEFNKETLSWGKDLTFEKNEEAFDRYYPQDVIKKVLKNQ